MDNAPPKSKSSPAAADTEPELPPAEDHIEALLDEALQETFPASDAPAPAVPPDVVPRPADSRPSNPRRR